MFVYLSVDSTYPLGFRRLYGVEIVYLAQSQVGPSCSDCDMYNMVAIHMCMYAFDGR